MVLPIIARFEVAGFTVGYPSRGDEWAASASLIVLWSKAFPEWSFVQREIRQAVEAWAAERLVLATLDDTPLPVGLRDIPAISLRRASDASRLIALAYSGQTALRGYSFFIALSAGILAALAVVVMWPPLGSHLIFGAIGVLLLTIIVTFGWISTRPNALTKSRDATPDVPSVFVSYSRKDRRPVNRLVKQMEQLGRRVWIDSRLGSSKRYGSQRYAAEIVYAIRKSRVVALMSSQNAFASDHVIREVYVAGDLKKPFVVFQLDPTEFPDEVLYFVSGFPRIPVTTLNQKQLRSEMARLT